MNLTLLFYKTRKFQPRDKLGISLNMTRKPQIHHKSANLTVSAEAWLQ